MSRICLEELVELCCPSKTVGNILAQESRRRCDSPFPSPSRTPSSRETTSNFKRRGSLPRAGLISQHYLIVRRAHLRCITPSTRFLLRGHPSLCAPKLTCGLCFRHCASPLVPPSLRSSASSPTAIRIRIRIRMIPSHQCLLCPATVALSPAHAIILEVGASCFYMCLA